MQPTNSECTEYSLCLHNERSAIDTAATELTSTAAHFGYSDAARFALRLAFEEATSNAFKHGKHDNGEGTIDLHWTASAQRIQVDIDDHGPGFDPHQIADPTEPEHIELLSGRGMLLMRAYMTRVKYNEKGNKVSLIYDRAAQHPGVAIHDD